MNLSADVLVQQRQRLDGKTVRERVGGYAGGLGEAVGLEWLEKISEC